MEKLAKYNITFIVAAVSSLTIISMCAYMIVNMHTYVMRVLMFIEFLCSFYFVCVFFYKMNRYSRIELFFYLVVYLVPFVLSILGYESKGFNDFLKKHLGLMKLLLCVVFLALFVLLVGNI